MAKAVLSHRPMPGDALPSKGPKLYPAASILSDREAPLMPKVRPSYDGRGVIVSEQTHLACLGRGMGGAGNKPFPPIVYLGWAPAGARPRDGQGEGALRRGPPLAGGGLVARAASPARADAGPPITGLTLDWSTYRQLAKGSDNWATTWAADGSLYAGFGDGNGFQGGRRSLGFARLTGGSAQAVQGTDLPGPPVAGKTYGVLALGDTLYAFVSPGSNAANYQEARLYRAPLGGGPWT